MLKNLIKPGSLVSHDLSEDGTNNTIVVCDTDSYHRDLESILKAPESMSIFYSIKYNKGCLKCYQTFNSWERTPSVELSRRD